MKRISRLTALLLALTMLLSVACVAEGTISQSEFNNAIYAQLVAAAQERNDTVGKTALTNKDNVEVRDAHYKTGKIIDTIEKKGTPVTITSVKDGVLGGGLFDSHWYGVSYEKNGETKTGYIETKYLDIQEEEPTPEVSYTPWDGTSEEATLAFTVTGAASYEWQRGLVQEDGSIIWEEGSVGDDSQLALDTTLDNLKYAYRCVAKNEAGEVIAESESVTLVRADIASWIEYNDIPVTEEMLALAMQATTLDSMMLLDNLLLHVRTGKPFAAYDEATQLLMHSELGIAFAKVVNNAIEPLVQAAEANQ